MSSVHTTPSSRLDQLALTTLKGVGPALAAKLAKLGLHTLQDLLFHLPLRYQDRTRITAIDCLQAGREAVLEGEVQQTDILFGRRRSLVCRIQDHTASITLRFYHFSAGQKNQLQPGARLRCFGEVRRGSSGLEIYHPEYQIITKEQPFQPSQQLTPIYPTREGLGQPSWRKLTEQALTYLNEMTLPELLPLPAIKQATTIIAALKYLHRPPSDCDQPLLATGQHPFQQRLAFEELVAHNLSLLTLRQQIQQLAAPALAEGNAIQQLFIESLPFALTNAQQRVSAAINEDLTQTRAMMRLVQGDVGSGKTVVAALAALRAIANGYQVALMAPTEILAEQHLATFSQWFTPLGISVGWLSGKLKGKARQQQLAAIAEQRSQLVVGTHALFQEEVVFAKLGLAIIDEQHRFGVHQRLALKEKALQVAQPHQLIMTATPIPRTLAMSAYADLDTSIIDELPPGRIPVNTVAIDSSRRNELISRVQQACREGKQVYWVCTLIEHSEALEAQAAEETCQQLSQALAGVRVGLIHGRMKATEKADIMNAYKAHQLDLLVATTVIEVGVDVPNASLMIIENPERLGLAQLHQLRGRVGRGSEASHCLLMYQSPLSDNAKARLHCH